MHFCLDIFFILTTWEFCLNVCNKQYTPPSIKNTNIFPNTGFYSQFHYFVLFYTKKEKSEELKNLFY